ncbi:MAG: hypothetical protein ACWA5T_06105 [Parvularcula sp.]
MASLPMTMDVVVLLACAAAILYCQQLARRLKRLHSLESGVGKAIVDLNMSIKGTNEANARIASQANGALEALDQAMQRVISERTAAEDTLEVLDGQMHQLQKILTQRLSEGEELSDRLETLTDRARIEMTALTKAVAITNKVSMLVSSKISRPTPSTGKGKFEPEVHTVQGQPAAAEGNPFRSTAVQAG